VGTPGRALVEGADRIRIHGKEVEVNAEVTRLEAFSAHADEDELVRWVSMAVPKRVALVHGEDEGREALAVRFGREFPDMEIIVPMRGDTIDV
ncbi:MAG TPA: MBL fold metallo-hydrolase RNA specificity domain-containing protein, partial [Acidimicrobiia bacterium]|nr:MBL fold metallo-hydrolase RNA specificity domain-containing protein [Acidimicrobiia bacterium]